MEEFALRYEIDPTLVTRIKRYYDLTWEKFQGADDINTILADLPSQLKMEVSESLFSRCARGAGGPPLEGGGLAGGGWPVARSD